MIQLNQTPIGGRGGFTSESQHFLNELNSLCFEDKDLCFSTIYIRVTPFLNKLIQYNHDEDLETVREDNQVSDELHDYAQIIIYYCHSPTVTSMTRLTPA